MKQSIIAVVFLALQPHLSSDENKDWQVRDFTIEVKAANSVTSVNWSKFAFRLKKRDVLVGFLNSSRTRLSVPERDFREVVSVADSLSIALLPPPFPISQAPELAPDCFQYMAQQDWTSLLRFCETRLRRDQQRSGGECWRLLSRECTERLAFGDEPEFPSESEFRETLQKLPREVVIRYLADRVLWQKGTVGDRLLVLPESLISMKRSRIFQDEIGKPARVKDELIDPCQELQKLELTVSELHLLVPHLMKNWHMLSRDGLGPPGVRLHPTTRYVFCKVVNTALGSPNAIREWHLTELGWSTESSVKQLLDDQIAQYAKSAAKE